MVVVEFRVRVPDVERLKRTWNKYLAVSEADGARNQQLFVSESDPQELTMLAEWESHDAMHASTEKHGAEFQREAGTEGLEWETRVLHRLA